MKELGVTLAHNSPHCAYSAERMYPDIHRETTYRWNGENVRHRLRICDILNSTKALYKGGAAQSHHFGRIKRLLKLAKRNYTKKNTYTFRLHTAKLISHCYQANTLPHWGSLLLLYHHLLCARIYAFFVLWTFAQTIKLHFRGCICIIISICSTRSYIL